MFLDAYREIWIVDFEFGGGEGNHPVPVCLVARELRANKLIRIFQDELHSIKQPPYSVGKDALFVGYFVSAELSCHLALGWVLPENVLDPWAEFRCMTNGLKLPSGASLLGAMVYFGLDCLSSVEKEDMRNLVLRGGPWSQKEVQMILDYCQTDVDSLTALFRTMEPQLDVPRAIHRGRYMKAVAKIEHQGIPIDTQMLFRLRERWVDIQTQLVSKIDADYRVYEGTSFRENLFESYLGRAAITWPRHPSGRLDLAEDTFREMAKIHCVIAPLHELRASIAQMRLSNLSVGSDGRNRCLLSPFRSITGRNQPSNSRFIFGPAVWLRFLIQPREGFGVAYVDWEQQEFGIAAALSGDPTMMAAYQSGDPYLAFAKQAGAVPSDATKESHGGQRELFKQCALAVQYGMGARSLAGRIGSLEFIGRDLLVLHQRTYPRFWEWSDNNVIHAIFGGSMWTRLGWMYRASGDFNCRSLANFPMQANGAEMLRLACCFATESGVKICAPVHDAVLIEAPMVRASEIILDGFQLRTDVKAWIHPNRYFDKRGDVMWKTIADVMTQWE